MRSLAASVAVIVLSLLVKALLESKFSGVAFFLACQRCVLEYLRGVIRVIEIMTPYFDVIPSE